MAKLSELRVGDRIRVATGGVVTAVGYSSRYPVEYRADDQETYYLPEDFPGDIEITERPFVVPPVGSIVQASGGGRNHVLVSHGEAGYSFISDQSADSLGAWFERADDSGFWRWERDADYYKILWSPES